MESVLIQTFHPGIADRRGKRVKRQWLGDTGNIRCAKRIDAEKANKPLVQQQLVAELVRFLAIGSRLAGALRDFFGVAVFLAGMKSKIRR